MTLGENIVERLITAAQAFITSNPDRSLKLCNDIIVEIKQHRDELLQQRSAEGPSFVKK